MFVGALATTKESEYIKIYNNLTYKTPNRAQVVKKIFISGDSEVKELYKILSNEYYYEIVVGTKFGKVILEGEELYSAVSTLSPYDKIENAIKKES